MKSVLMLTLVAIALGGCNNKEAQREAERKMMQVPGYREAKIICSQCHQMPFSDQHIPAAWPGVIERMENYIQAGKRRLPTQQEHQAILNFFQNNRY
ncbi:MAG: hypothetical protein WA632_09725 [Gallionella sp.]